MDIRIIDQHVRSALKEDMGTGDITTRFLVPEGLKAEAVIIVREPMVVCGIECVKRAFYALDKNIRVLSSFDDGCRVKPGQEIVSIQGQARAILTAERVALNFMGRLSGIASVTRAFVDAVRGTKAVILDTRKTTAGMRALDRHAVRMGGGENHRFDLGEMILVKDNHRFLSAECKNLGQMVRKLRLKTKKKIEVEVDTLTELTSALTGSPDMILLDNMPVGTLRQAIRIISRLPRGSRPLLEASGGVSLKNVKSIAMTGIDRISVGALTHSARWMDLSLEIRRVIHV